MGRGEGWMGELCRLFLQYLDAPLLNVLVFLCPSVCDCSSANKSVIMNTRTIIVDSNHV